MECILSKGAYGDELEHKSYCEAAERPRVVQSREKELRGDFISLCNCLKGGCIEIGISLFSQVIINRTRNGHVGKFRLDIRKNFFTLRVVRHWNKLSTEVVETPSLAALEEHVALEDMVQWQQS